MSEPQQPEDESVGVDSDVGSGFRKSLGAIVIVAVMSAGIWFALTSPDRLLSGSDEPVTPPSPQRVTPPSAPTLAFVDRATEAGVDFVHDSGARGAKLLPECLSGGVSVADLNADGKPDLVFAQGQPLDDEPTDASNAKGGIVVYRNASNANGLAFVRDASPEFGDAGLYANGFALGDVNADGKPDLYVTARLRSRIARETQAFPTNQHGAPQRVSSILMPTAISIFSNCIMSNGRPQWMKRWASRSMARIVPMDRRPDLAGRSRGSI